MSNQPVNEYEAGASDERPWGTWRVLATGNGYAVKEIVVNPGEVLSLQSHAHRAEHWVILSGVADVTIGDDTVRREENDSAFIPVGAKHRISNPGDTPMRFIEVQTGAHLSEADITRYEDRYGRSG